MKKVTQLNLRDEIFIVGKDYIDQSVSEREWYEVKRVKVRSLRLDDSTDSIIVNEGLVSDDGVSPAKQTLALHEDVYTNESEAKILVKNLNDKEENEEIKQLNELQRQVAIREKNVKFFKDLKKVMASQA